MKNKNSNLISLFPLFESLFGISKIETEDDFNRLIEELRKLPNQELPIQKYIELYEKGRMIEKGLFQAGRIQRVQENK